MNELICSSSAREFAEFIVHSIQLATRWSLRTAHRWANTNTNQETWAHRAAKPIQQLWPGPLDWMVYFNIAGGGKTAPHPNPSLDCARNFRLNTLGTGHGRPESRHPIDIPPSFPLGYTMTGVGLRTLVQSGHSFAPHVRSTRYTGLHKILAGISSGGWLAYKAKRSLQNRQVETLWTSCAQAWLHR